MTEWEALREECLHCRACKASFSVFSGSRFWGGRHLTELVM